MYISMVQHIFFLIVFALNIIPIPFDILFLTYVICEIQFSLLSIITYMYLNDFKCTTDFV